MKVCSCSPQRHNNSILSFLAPPYQPASAKAMLDKLPFPDQLPLTALYRHAVEQVCDRRRNKWHRTGWLLARAGYVYPCCKVMCYGICAFVLRCFFSVLTLYSQMEHRLGVNFFFSPPSPHVMLYSSSIPCLPVLSTPLSYVCCVCMDRLMANFAGTCD